MRMWLCDPRILCQKHLCGEHVEMHMFMGCLKKNKKIDGYIKKNLFEPMALIYRHDKLAEEMVRRGFNHKTPIEECECKHIMCLPFYQRINEIDREAALKDLLDRCPKCRKRFTNYQEAQNGTATTIPHPSSA